MKSFAYIMMIGCSLVAGMLVGEVFVRVIYHSSAQYFVFPPKLEHVTEPIPKILPGVEGRALFTVNTLGLRGRELSADDQVKILTVGGSSTECMYLDDKEAWPSLLESKLNESGRTKFWVGNAGKAGLTTRDNVVQLLHLLDQVPQVKLVVASVGFNDLVLATSLREHYHSIDIENDQALMELVGRAFSVYPKHFQFFPPKYMAIADLLRGLKGKSSLPWNSWDPHAENVRHWRENRLHATHMRSDLPDLSVPLREFSAALGKLARLSAQKGVKVLFVTQPVLWRPGMPDELKQWLWFGGIGADFKINKKAEYYPVETLSQVANQYKETLLGTCATLKASCFDLDALLPKDLSVFYDDVHFNEAGSRRVAEILSRQILKLEVR